MARRVFNEALDKRVKSLLKAKEKGREAHLAERRKQCEGWLKVIEDFRREAVAYDNQRAGGASTDDPGDEGQHGRADHG